MSPSMPQQALGLLRQAAGKLQAQAYDEAEALLHRVLVLHSRNFDALHFLGFIKGMQNKHREATGFLRKAAQLEPAHGPVQLNLAKALFEDGQLEPALTHYQKAVELLPAHSQAWEGLGETLLKLNQGAQALGCFERAIHLQPEYAQAWTNRGICLLGMQRLDEARASIEKSRSLNPVLAETHIAMGLALERQGLPEEAFQAYSRAIEGEARCARAHYLQGRIRFEQKRFEEALELISQAVELDPTLTNGASLRLHIKSILCDWRDLDEDARALLADIERDKPSAAHAPFFILSSPGSARQLKRCAELFTRQAAPSSVIPFQATPRTEERLTTLGFYSTDFGDHPVSQLLVELLEKIDRTKFRLIGFSLKTREASALQKRIHQAFDQVIAAHDISDEEIVRRSREHSVRIAVDLNGYTGDHRSDIFAMRVAPIQVSYLGFAGTMGAPFMDYLIADEISCPQSQRPHYTEKLAYLPGCFMPHDGEEAISALEPTRKDLGLPDQGFVFCGFNNHFKISPEVFAIWMQWLQKIPNSALWLSDGAAAAKHNLAQEAARHGVDPARIIYAARTQSKADHLARYRKADLFVDTFHYNAHTNACDALWAGLPVLTCMGETFASRVAGSLLTHAGLPEMITHAPNEYAQMGLALAQDRQRLLATRNKLGNTHALPLFDTATKARHLAQLFEAMLDRHNSGLAPDHISITP